MMRNLLLDEGDFIRVESASLPVATFSKFQPQSEDFLDITNPKAVLENALRNFACLTAGDVVAITYNDRVYELSVLETKPGNAVSIIECDMNVEFAAPVGYSEPTRIKKEDHTEEVMDTFDPSQFTPEVEGFVAFTGSVPTNGVLPPVKFCGFPLLVNKDPCLASPAFLNFDPETLVDFGSGISSCPGDAFGASGAPAGSLLDAGVGVGSVAVNGVFFGFLKS